METDPTGLVAANRGFVIAPAGCGKTELIAGAVQHEPGRSLVLTHTHAGVSALKARLSRFGVPHGKAEVQTIAGWALRYALAYPATSGLTTGKPEGADWQAVYDAAIRLLATSNIRRVVRESFAGVFVDEYQDCNLRQHEIVMALAEILPCRLLGDPLQAIFDFAEPTIDWKQHVAPNFERLDDLTTPHRWATHNRDLGDWLMQMRDDVIQGRSLDLASGPGKWTVLSDGNQRQVCWDAARNPGESVVAIGKWPNECHEFASGLRGTFTSMEELDCRALMEFAAGIDSADGPKRAVVMMDAASRCFTALSTLFKPWRVVYSGGLVIDTSRLTVNLEVVESLNALASSATLDARVLVRTMRAIDKVQGTVLYRRELWREMLSSALSYSSGARETLHETAWLVRDRSRRMGRKTEQRIVSRTLLVKGLEFDSCVVLDAGKLSAKELYVALTRGRSRLSVLSRVPVVQFPVPSNIV